MTGAEKARLRGELRRRLRSIPPDQAARSDALICGQLLSLPEYAGARTVFAFAGVDWEIRLTAFLARALAEGKRVALPRVTGPGRMEARVLSHPDRLVPGAFGIPEPPEDAALCPPEEIDLAVVPCVCCDKSGRRLGQGGGFYDRFLAFPAAFPAAAVCRDAVLARELPSDPWDRPVDLVVTETQVYRTAAAPEVRPVPDLL